MFSSFELENDFRENGRIIFYFYTNFISNRKTSACKNYIMLQIRSHYWKFVFCLNRPAKFKLKKT